MVLHNARIGIWLGDVLLNLDFLLEAAAIRHRAYLYLKFAKEDWEFLRFFTSTNGKRNFVGSKQRF